MTLPSLKAYGPNAWLIESSDHLALRKIASLCDQIPPPDFSEWVIAQETLLLIFKHPFSIADLDSYLTGVSSEQNSGGGSHHEVPVRYDGPDLEEISEAIGMPCEEVIQLHSTPAYTVRFLGFSPGFGYLDGLDSRLILPRRATPRTRMEPGAVAIGGPHAGVYTVPSPGGWNWLGNTTFPLFDPATEYIALRPGDTVRFIPEDV